MSYAKAIIGAAVAGLTAVAAGLDDSTLTGQEIVGAVVAALVALGAVWAVPNRQTPPPA